MALQVEGGTGSLKAPDQLTPGFGELNSVRICNSQHAALHALCASEDRYSASNGCCVRRTP